MELTQTLSKQWTRLLAAGDARSNALPYIRDPTVVVCSTLVYLAIVKIGPRIMASREAFSLRRVIIVYNFLCVVLSAWMMWEFFATTFLQPNFDLLREPFVETDTSPNTMRLINAHWWYFASKIVEFADTFFFILRKKNNQISFLHVYHHASMALITWGMVKWVPGACTYMGPLCNCFIHAVMYLYYMLSAFGPHMQKYLWWKRYLTRMQLTQFLIVFLYCVHLIRFVQDAALFFSWLKLTYMITLMILFGNFYVQAYRKSKKTE